MSRYVLVLEPTLDRAPLLADKLSINSNHGVDHVANAILRAIFADRLSSVQWDPYYVDWPDGSQMVVLPIRPLVVASGTGFFDSPFYGRLGHLSQLTSADQFALCISKHPITNAQFQRFVDDQKDQTAPSGAFFSHGAWKEPFFPWRHPEFKSPDKPVVCVNLPTAKAYCDWLNHKLREVELTDCATILPTPAIWGDTALTGHDSAPEYCRDLLPFTKEIHHNAAAPTEIDDAGKRTNHIGESDMLGNVWEWCYLKRRDLHPTLTHDGTVVAHTVRGGSYLDDIATCPRVSAVADGGCWRTFART